MQRGLAQKGVAQVQISEKACGTGGDQAQKGVARVRVLHSSRCDARYSAITAFSFQPAPDTPKALRSVLPYLPVCMCTRICPGSPHYSGAAQEQTFGSPFKFPLRMCTHIHVSSPAARQHRQSAEVPLHSAQTGARMCMHMHVRSPAARQHRQSAEVPLHSAQTGARGCRCCEML